MATALASSALAAVGGVAKDCNQVAVSRTRALSSSFPGTCLPRLSVNQPLAAVGPSPRQRQSVRSAAVNDDVQAEVDERVAEYLPSGEWPETFSLLNFEDVSGFYEPVLFKEGAQPGTYLADIMARTVYSAKPDTPVKDVVQYFTKISGLPVVDENLKCIGVLSKKDVPALPEDTLLVKDIMSSPAITVDAEKTVSDAAVLMLKHKVHRIPVVNEDDQVVGMVTRTDIFTALEQEG